MDSPTPRAAGASERSAAHHLIESPAADAAGVAVSVACAVHCAATPVFLAAVSMLGLSGGDGPLVEWGFLGASVLIGTLALRVGFRRHHHPWPLRAFAMGLLALGFARLAGEERPFLEIPLVIGGASAIVAAHVSNWRARRRCRP